MVQIINGEIVPDDKVPKSKPTTQPFPQAWSSSNQGAQQYQYVHPNSNQNTNAAQPPQNNNGGQFGFLEENRTILGNTVSVKHLLIVAAIIAFVWGIPGAVMFLLVCYAASSDAANQWFGSASGARRNAPVNQRGGGNPISSFFSSMITPPAQQADPNDPNSQGQDQGGQQAPRGNSNQRRGGNDRFGSINSVRNDDQ
eukprot:TRINITY_DN6050_c0_g1_i2.p1 TRINITY_DN6050_c0_g1~~TRINITY_DN6050_c0_g1_i2.p1  ORF type:complete len:198 (+),score=12.15 TRINITY_DN6050_c0_g1_i2:145-738(+)